nr:putative ribonuclease H-like domain-containing protein [Tanacetum cinerariifolium]
MARAVRDQGGISQMFNEDFHTCMFACFLSQEEPKRVHQALKDPSWIEAMQEELLQFKMQKVWIFVDLPYEKRAIGCYLRKVVIEIAVLNILSDALPITTNGIQRTMVFNSPMLHLLRVEMVINLPWMLSKNWLVQKQTAFELASPKANDSWENGNCDSPLLGVNTPRSDEDRLKLMELMVFLLQKAVCDDIGITTARLSSYCCQANVSVVWLLLKRSGDVTMLQALVDKKNIVISEVVIREILQLNDAEGVVCLPTDEIFAGLAQIGYEKPTSWNEFSTAMASAVICLSKGQRFNFSKYIFDSLVRNVDNSSKFYMYPRFIQLIIQAQVGDLSTHTTRFISPALTQKVFANMRRVGKGFLGVETPLFEGRIADRQHAEAELGAEQVHVNAAVAVAVVEDVAADVAHVATPSPPPHGIPSPPQELSLPPQQPHVTPSRLKIVKLKARVKKLEKTDKVKSLKFRRLRNVEASRQVESSNDMEDVFNQGRMMNEDEGIKLEDDSEVQEVVEVVTTAKLITEVVTAAASQVSAVSITIPAAKPSIPAAAPTVVVAYTRRRKGVIIRDPEEELSLKTPAKTSKVKDKGKGIMVEAPKPMKKKDQIEMDAEYARKLQEEIDRDHDSFNKDVDWDAAMDHVNQKSSRNGTPAQKAAKRRKLNEEAQEAEDLMKRLEVVEDEDDDVFVEATPLASKVPVIDNQIVLIDNKPRTMFEEPDGQDAIWRNQKSVHSLALVKRWKLLTSCGVHVITLSTV